MEQQRSLNHPDGLGNRSRRTTIACAKLRTDAPEGGDIGLRLRNTSSHSVELLVEDSGRGIPEEKINQIFDPCMVGQFKGSIGVASEPGKTVFRIVFPLRKVDE
jgi:signal transduction histidine kinase